MDPAAAAGATAAAAAATAAAAAAAKEFDEISERLSRAKDRLDRLKELVARPDGVADLKNALRDLEEEERVVDELTMNRASAKRRLTAKLAVKRVRFEGELKDSDSEPLLDVAGPAAYPPAIAAKRRRLRLRLRSVADKQ